MEFRPTVASLVVTNGGKLPPNPDEEHLLVYLAIL